MNWDQFKDPASHMCPAGTVVASCSLTQEPFYCNDRYFCHGIQRIQ